MGMDGCVHRSSCMMRQHTPVARVFQLRMGLRAWSGVMWMSRLQWPEVHGVSAYQPTVHYGELRGSASAVVDAKAVEVASAVAILDSLDKEAMDLLLQIKRTCP